MRKFTPRFTPAMAVAILALVIALSSSATAAMMISGAQIRDHTITAKDLKKGAVRSLQVKNRSLRGIDLRKRTITRSNVSSTLIKRFTRGANGFAVVTANSAPAALPLLVPLTATATCPARKVAISANAYWLGKTNLAPPQVRRNGPASFTAETSFTVNLLGGDVLQLQVTCVKAG